MSGVHPDSPVETVAAVIWFVETVVGVVGGGGGGVSVWQAEP